MKKRLLVLMLIMPFIGGCKKEKKDFLTQQIIGQWALYTPAREATNPTLTQYFFDSWGNFHSEQLVLEAKSNKVLGYQSKTFGKYQIEGNQITLEGTEYGNDFSKGEYSSEDKLIKKTPPPSYYNIEISNDVLTLSFSCGPNAYCIGDVVYAFRFQRQSRE